MAGAAVIETVLVPSATPSTAGMASPPALSTAGVAPEMAGWLARVLGAAGPGGLSGVSSEQALAVVEAVEAVKSWADAVSIEATAVMVAEFEADFEADFADLGPEPAHSGPALSEPPRSGPPRSGPPQSGPPSAWERRRIIRTCRSAAAREIQVAIGLPITECQRRVRLSACEVERVRPVLDQLRLGTLTLARAMTLVEATRGLDAFTASVIATRVLRPLTGPDGLPLPGTAPISQATFRARLHRQLVLAHGLIGQAERTHAEALKARRASSEPQRDGTGVMLISGDGPRVAAAAGRVDTIARALRKRGDPRTLDQLRADVATDLLLRGWIPTDPTFTALGQPPVATVQLLVSLTTLLGLDHGAGQITGWGDVPARAARQLALQLGSIWKRVVTDPLTGRAIEVSAPTYRVPGAMAEQVTTRDRTCRAPGCQIPTDHADLDHTQEWKPDGAGGETTETNLAALHRGHHNLKTAGLWDSHQSPDGTLRWTTTTGRTITTYPYVYDHPDNLPVKVSPLEARLGRQVAAVINPDIPMPGHLNIFDEIDWAQTLAPATVQRPQHQWKPEPNKKHPTTWAARDDGPPPF